MAVAVVGSATTDISTAGRASITLTRTGVTAGNVLALWVGGNTQSTAVSGGGATWTYQENYTSTTYGLAGQWVIGTGTTGGSITVTVTLNGSNSITNAILLELSGAAATPFQSGSTAVAAGTTSGDTVTSNTVVPNSTGDLVLIGGAGTYNQSNNLTTDPGSPWTNWNGATTASGNQYVDVATQTATAGISYSAAFSSPNTQSIVALCASAIVISTATAGAGGSRSTAATFSPTISAVSGNPSGCYDLVSTTAAATSTSTIDTFTSTTAGWLQAIPLTSTSGVGATAAPTTGAAATNKAWRALTTETSSISGAQRMVPAGTWTFNLNYTTTAPAALQTQSIVFLVIVYQIASGGTSTELFRTTSATQSSTAAATKSLAVTSAAQPAYVLPVGALLQIEVWVQSAATSVLGSTTNSTVTLNTGPSATNIALPAPGLRTAYSQAPADMLTVSDTDTRTAAHPRTTPDTTTISDTPTRRTTNTRTSSDAVTTSDTPTRTAAHPRSSSDTTTVTDNDARIVAFARLLADTTTVADLVTRAEIEGRLLVDTVTLADSVARALIYGRFEYDNIGPTPQDYKGTTPTKKLADYVVDKNGAPLAGITVNLIREADNAVVASTVSGSDGSWSFTRDAYDPNTYHVEGASTISGQAVQGESNHGLVPS